MEKERKVKYLSIVALIVAVVGLGVAFAAMSTTLTINGTATMDTAKWDIHFENLSTVKLGGFATETATPEMTATKIGDYAVTLTRPGDSATYTFDVTNAGTIDAKLGTFTKNAPVFTGTSATAKAADEAIVEGNLIYTLTYTDTGVAVAQDDILGQGETKNLTLHIEYDRNATTLPSAKVEITGMDITMVYDQYAAQ